MKSKALLPGAVLASSFAAHGAALLPGTKVGVDYGPTLTTNWNNFTGNGSKAVGTVVHLDGTVSDLLAMTVSNGQFFNNDGTNNWVGLQSNPTSIAPNPKAPAEFVDSVTTDIAGNFSLGDANPFRLVVTGLNPYLTYKVDAVSSAAGGANTESMTILGDATYGPTAISRPLTVSQGLYHSFASVLPTTGGELTFNSIDSGAGTNPILNGILIEALAPTAAGLLDDDGDGMPNWWEASYQFLPGSNVDGGSADFDLDGVSNVDEFLGGSDPRDPLSTPAVLWAVDGDGAWNTPANWSSGSVPNSPDRFVKLPATALATAAGATIALDIPVTLGRLEVTGGKPFTLGAANPLTFSTAAPKALLSTAADAGSSLEILGNVVLASPLDVTTSGTSAITIGGTLTETAGPHAITKIGTGDLMLAGDASGFTGAVTLNEGRLVLDRPGAITFDNVLSGAGSLLHAGGGTLSMSFANSHGGGTQVTNAGTLALDNASPLGSGTLILDDGTLHATADVSAANQSLNVGTGGGTVDVDDGFLLTTGGPAAGSGTVTKTGAGSWRIQGGNAGTIGLFTVAEGFVDFNRNDTFGNHTASQQDLFIGSGATVTNGSGATGFNTFRSLTLSGGTLSVTNSLNALTGRFQAYSFKQSITVTGSSASLIDDLVAGPNGAINIGGTADLGGGRGSDLLIDVEDVTASSAPDLTISAKLKNSVGPVGAFANLATGIVKEGLGTLLLSGTNSYTGDTTVNEGTLVIGQAVLEDTADVIVDAAAVLQLDFAGTDTIDQLSLGGAFQQPGEYGAEGSGAEFESPLITGTGKLDVTAGPSLTPFESWLATNHPSLVAPDNDPGDDPDNDGVTNFEEFAFSGNPTSGSDQGARRIAIDDVAGTDHLTLTLALRTGATFTGSGPLTATIDGIDYTVRGSTDLAGFTTAVSEIPAITTGLPTAAPGYTYRTFRITAPVSAGPKAFLQALAAEDLP
jgi:autotransporter-associated beta strand protein